MSATLFFLSPPPPNLYTFSPTPSPKPTLTLAFPSFSLKTAPAKALIRDFRVFCDDGDADMADDGDVMDGEEDVDELEDELEADNRPDYDVEYEQAAGGDDEIAMVDSKSFMSIDGWGSEQIVDYRINEDEFHKISLMDCDFFIRKPPDPDNDVYDFREMYVTPPDTDVYAIPRVLAPLPQKYIRCAKSDYGLYNVTEPMIENLRDPMYKSEWEVMKVFLTKHYRNRRLGDPEFVLDLEEIYVIDSKTRSITRAKILVTVPEGRDRDRRNDLLVVRDNGNSFKIIRADERDDPSTVIQKEEWVNSRKEMETHLRKLRDFSVSNWF